MQQGGQERPVGKGEPRPVLLSCRSRTVIWWRSARISTSLPRSLTAVRAGLDEIYEQAAQARRAARAAAGTKAPAAQPGGLREKVLAHLRDHPAAASPRTRSTR